MVWIFYLQHEALIAVTASSDKPRFKAVAYVKSDCRSSHRRKPRAVKVTVQPGIELSDEA